MSSNSYLREWRGTIIEVSEVVVRWTLIAVLAYMVLTVTREHW